MGSRDFLAPNGNWASVWCHFLTEYNRCRCLHSNLSTQTHFGSIACITHTIKDGGLLNEDQNLKKKKKNFTANPLWHIYDNNMTFEFISHFTIQSFQTGCMMTLSLWGWSLPAGSDDGEARRLHGSARTSPVAPLFTLHVQKSWMKQPMSKHTVCVRATCRDDATVTKKSLQLRNNISPGAGWKHRQAEVSVKYMTRCCPPFERCRLDTILNTDRLQY